jgi:hypothetical protein
VLTPDFWGNLPIEAHPQWVKLLPITGESKERNLKGEKLNVHENRIPQRPISAVCRNASFGEARNKLQDSSARASFSAPYKRND